MTVRDQIQELETLVRARYPILYVVTWEETRVVNEIVRIAQEREKRVMEWSVTTGLTAAGTSLQKQRDNGTRDPLAALDRVVEDIEPAIYVFKDFHHFMNKQNIAILRRLREAAQQLKHSMKTLLLVAPSAEIPADLEKEITVIDFPLPDADDISALLARIEKDLAGNTKVVVDLDEAAREKLVKATLGLTLSEAENVFARTLVTTRRLDGNQVAQVFAEKKQLIRKSGLLEYIEVNQDLSVVGGLDVLKGWLKKRTIALTDEARHYGLPAPRGVLLLGVQGCGKSLTAKAIGQLWGMPLLRFDVGKMFGSLVGSSEQNIRRAIQTAESIAPCVLWIDEIDKAFARQNAGSDGGTATRVFGTFLSWMSEKKEPVFVVATANDISNLPPELLRKGRMDEIFFVDLPNHEERHEIFRIHLARRERDPAAYDLDALARQSEGFSGAEIEESIIAALFNVFSDKTELSTDAIAHSLRETVPLSRTMEEELVKLRQWASGRARAATSAVSAKPGATMRRIEL